MRKLMKYKIGMKIKILNMKDDPTYKNKIGKITFIDDLDQLHGTWGSLAVIPQIDKIKIIKEKKQ